MKKNDKEKMKKILKILLKYKRDICFVFLILCMCTMIALIQPQIWAKILTGITQKNNIFWLIIYAFIMFLCQALEVYFEIVQVKITQYVQQNIVIEMRKNAIKNVISMKIQDYIIKSKGELLSRIISDTEEIANGIMGELINIIFNIIKILFISIFLCATNIYLAIFTIIYQSVVSFLLQRHEDNIRKKCMENSNINDKYIAEMEMIIGGIVEIQNLNIEDEVYEKSNNIIKAKKYIHMELLKNNIKYQGEVQISNYIYQLLILIMGIYFLNIGMIDFQNFVAFSSYSSIFSSAITAVYGLRASYVKCFNSMERYYQLIEENNGINKKEDKMNLGEIYSMELREISFSYDWENIVIKKINAIFKRGNMNFIIGKSGSGKTTLLMIMLGLFSNYQGQIYINQQYLVNMKGKRLNREIVLISQNPYFLENNILENLQIVNRKKKKEEIDFACKLVEIYDEIMNMPNGYETELINNAENLSTGQRQRLAIARVLLLDFQVLLCDEILSNVDPISRKKILSALRKIAKEKIVIFVTHHMDIIEKNDYTLDITAG